MPVTVRTKRLPKLTYVDEIPYVRQRVQDTFIFNSKGKMVYARNVGHGPVVYWCDSKGKEEIEPLADVDLTPFKYGYANLEGSAVYIMRLPLRNDWRQGNRINQLIFRSYFKHPNIDRDHLGNGMWELKDTVENTYYSYQKCLDMIEDGYTARSINRDFALDNEFKFFYRGTDVGSINPDNGKVVLLPNYHWLQESVNESEVIG